MITISEISEEIKIGDLLVTQLGDSVVSVLVMSNPIRFVNFICMDCLIDNAFYMNFSFSRFRKVLQWVRI